LRTILELFFVIAVVFAFFYWRNVPQDASGRFQLQSIEKGEVLYIDTQSGRVWRGWSHGQGWREISTPDVGTKK
jgi:hypothetical protein